MFIKFSQVSSQQIWQEFLHNIPSASSQIVMVASSALVELNMVRHISINAKTSLSEFSHRNKCSTAAENCFGGCAAAQRISTEAPRALCGQLKIHTLESFQCILTCFCNPHLDIHMHSGHPLPAFPKLTKY